MGSDFEYSTQDLSVVLKLVNVKAMELLESKPNPKFSGEAICSCFTPFPGDRAVLPWGHLVATGAGSKQ